MLYTASSVGRGLGVGNSDATESGPRSRIEVQGAGRRLARGRSLYYLSLALALALAESAASGSQAPTAIGVSSSEEHPTFWEHVYPMLRRHCAPCHRQGGSAPFPLDTFSQARSRTQTISAAIESGYMPPWLPAFGFGEFKNARRLPDAAAQVWRQWIRGGRKEGSVPVLTETEGVQRKPKREPDLIVSMPEAFSLPADGNDIFRSFVLPTNLSSGRWVEAVEFRIPDKRLVHHATLRLDRFGNAQRAALREGSPGFSGMDSDLLGEMPDGQLLGWTPGRDPRVGYAGLPWRLAPGTDLIVEMHMLPSGKPEAVQVGVGLYFTENGPANQPFVVQLAGGIDMQIPPGEEDYLVVDSYRLPVDVVALAIYPHAHYLGKSVECVAKLPDGTTRWLLRIKEWDFNWQDIYEFREPIRLPQGTMLSTRLSFDNSDQNPRNPSIPPRTVRFGPHSSDEMAVVWIQVLPASRGERDSLRQDYVRQRLLSDIAGWRSRINDEPGNPRSHNSLGVLLVMRGDLTTGANHFHQALELDPTFADALYNLGVYYTRVERPKEALRYLRRLLEVEPDHPEGNANLGLLELNAGNPRLALEPLARAVEEKPGLTLAHYHRGMALGAIGRHTEAVLHLQRVVEQRPEWSDGHNQLGVALARSGSVREAAGAFQRALDLDPESKEARENLALAESLLLPVPGARRPQ